jgi:stage II sporulation protein D
VVVYSVGDVEVRAGASAAPGLVCRGRIELSAQGMPPGKISVQSAKFGRAPASRPCTLLARGKNNFFEYNEKSYRGSFAAVTDGLNGFTLVNIIDVEDYLRGVVALEIGKLGNAEVEAVKAQAVAARTYTYRRIQQKTQSPFDLLPDVSDQVYGGVNAEHPVCDKAVETTKDIILVYKGSICMTYYHSTCGGRTANVEDVWSKSGDPYLRSISDTGPNGSAWCRISKAYSWQCSWTKERLGKICAAFGKKAFPSLSAPNGNPVKEISVQKRYGCGRVESCIIRTDNGTYEYGSDRIRFVLRQDRRGDPILPSANFTVEKTNGDTLKLSGHGNGHGVGMCQMGAIGRARAGQSYEQILKAYYRGAELRRVRP